MTALEYFQTGSKKGRGRARKSLDIIEAMRDVAVASYPIAGRGIGYKLFTRGLIPSMSRFTWSRGAIALLQVDLADLPSFPASDKRRDPRCKWFVENFGTRNAWD